MSNNQRAGRQATPRWSVDFLNQHFVPDTAATAQLLGDMAEATARVANCRVFASRRSYIDPRQVYQPSERWNGVRVVRVGGTALGRSSLLRRSADYASFLLALVLRLTAERRADVVVALSTPPILGALAVARARLTRARAVYWAMDVYPDVAFSLGVMDPHSLAGRASARLASWTAKRADLVVAVGESMAAHLRRQGARKVIVVHNWADGDAIRPTRVEDSRYRRRAGWNGQFVVHYSGNMGLVHEFDTLLGAARELASDAGIRFAFLGHGPRKEELRRRVSELNLESVDLLPGVERRELGDTLAAGELHVVTLRRGAQGLVVPSKIYGILAAGRPVLYVGPRDGEMFDIVQRGQCGACVDNGDVQGLVEAIRRFRGDPELRARAGQRARDLFDQEFGMAGQTARLLQAVLSLAGPADRVARADAPK